MRICLTPGSHTVCDAPFFWANVDGSERSHCGKRLEIKTCENNSCLTHEHRVNLLVNRMQFKWEETRFKCAHFLRTEQRVSEQARPVLWQSKGNLLRTERFALVHYFNVLSRYIYALSLLTAYTYCIHTANTWGTATINELYEQCMAKKPYFYFLPQVYTFFYIFTIVIILTYVCSRDVTTFW